MGWTGALVWLAPFAMAAAVAATGYTGLLFAQGLARDLWQGPHATLDLLAQAAAEGSAAMLLVGAALGAESQTTGTLAMTLGLASLVHLGILLLEHVLTPSATLGHELAVRAIRRGVYARLFWIGAIGLGGLAPIAHRLAGARRPRIHPILAASAAIIALAGGFAWEYVWVEAGQAVPNS